jgi:ketosteroid isomerase-like protein
VRSQENVELVRRGFEAYNRGDIEGMLALADPPPEFEFVPSGVLIPDLSGVQRGPEGFRRLAEAFFGEFDAVQVEVHELIDAGDQVFSSFTLQGRGRQSGVETTFDGWLVWTVRDGRIARLLGFTDRDPALEAAGLSE